MANLRSLFGGLALVRCRGQGLWICGHRHQKNDKASKRNLISIKKNLTSIKKKFERFSLIIITNILTITIIITITITITISISIIITITIFWPSNLFLMLIYFF